MTGFSGKLRPGGEGVHSDSERPVIPLNELSRPRGEMEIFTAGRNDPGNARKELRRISLAGFESFPDRALILSPEDKTNN